MPTLDGSFKAEISALIARKASAGLRLGLIPSAIGFLRIILWSRFSPVYDPSPFLVATTVGLAVVWGSLMGSMLPLALKRLGLAPAPSGAPFVAILADVT